MSDELKMQPELKAKWVAALRSGEFKQGKERLEKDGRFCCLGVLNRIQGNENGDRGTIAVWERPVGISSETRRRLEGMNDGHGNFKQRSFKYIADWIEKHL